MSCNYVVTAQRATGITAATKCSFTDADAVNLITVRNTRIEIFVVTADGLKLVKEISVHGRVSILMPFRPPGEKKDLLFMLTAKYNAAVLEWRSDGEIITKSYGNVAENTGRQSETGMIAIVDPESKYIGLRLVDGLFKVIQWQGDSRELKLTSLRMEHMNVIDIAFLHGFEHPTLAFIHQSSNNGRHIQTCELNLNEKELMKGPWKQENIESEAQFIIPVPAPVGGVIVIGEESITYHVSETRYVAVAPPIMRHSTMVVWESIDSQGLRYLLGDMAGRLFMLVIETDCETDGSVVVRDLKVEVLGETVIAENLVYLDNGVVFVGSRLGDSQLIRLTADPDEKGSYVTVLDSYTNLGPIVDMVVVDLERQGQNQLVTCSNAFKEGSLRVIRNGVGIHEHASIDLPGIKGIWALNYDRLSSSLSSEEKNGENPSKHNCLALSFVGRTRTLLLNGEEVEESELPGFEYDEQTFFAGHLPSKNILQVTEKSARLIRSTASSNDEAVCDIWRVPANEDATSFRRINVVACSISGGQVLVASGCDLYYLVVEGEKLVQKSHSKLDYEIACLDMSLLGDSGVAEVAAVGLWTEISVKLLHLPSMQLITHEPLGGDVIPRSVLMCRFEGILYLLVALGDGTLLYYRMHQTSGALIDKKKMTLGTHPAILKTFNSRGSVNVFGCSDRPTIVYSSNQKLVFSNVNLRAVSWICSLTTAVYDECLAITDGQSLFIGSVDEIQKLHIRTIALGESPRRIAYQNATKTFGVLTQRYEMLDANGQPITTRQSASILAQTTSHSGQARQTTSTTTPAASTSQVGAEGEAEIVHNLLILDQNTFEIIHAHQLAPNEHGCSLVSCKLSDDPVTYYIVGTALVQPDESEAKHGRLLVFEYSCSEATGPQLQLVHEKEIKGAPYSLCEFNGKLLASVNSSVRLFEWSSSPGEKELRLECSHFTFIVALYVKVKGDFVLVGDLMRSMTLLLYKPMEASFEEIARDYQPNWMTAVEIIDDDTFLGAENSFNMFTCQKDSAATTDEDRQHLQEVGKYHVGEMINVFQHGSLVMQQNLPSEQQTGLVPIGDISFASTPILFGTVLGAIGLVVQLTEPYFKFLQQLETRLAKVVCCAGKVEHCQWRSFHTERRTEAACGFIDGDLIDAFLDLPRHQMADVVRDLRLPRGGLSDDASEKEAGVDDVIKIVEELSRLN